MTFTDNIKKIEQIKKNNGTNFLQQEFLMINPISNIAGAAIVDDVITETFAKLVAPYLSKSDFNIFNKVLLNNEIDFISNAIGYGDVLLFSYDSKKQVNRVKYQTSDKRINITLKSRGNKATIVKTIYYDDKIHETKSVFRKCEDGYYQESITNALIKTVDEFTTTAADIYRYDYKNDELVKEFKVVTKERGEVISKSSISTIIDKSDYVIDNRRFYTINKKQESNKMKKCKKLENRLVESFN